MKPIGGYFELELNGGNSMFHDKAIALNSGRNALEYILRSIMPRKVYLPYYTCSVILQPFDKLSIDLEFYHLDKNFMPLVRSVGKKEAILYVNYFGTMMPQVRALTNIYDNLVIDNSQAFFSKPFADRPTFYSPRKFFGLPDGGFAYCKRRFDDQFPEDKSISRFSHLLHRIENGAEFGYPYFLSENLLLDNQPISKMSIITSKLLSNINFEEVRKIRNRNFSQLHNVLGQHNELSTLIDDAELNGPMVYPFLKKGNQKLKQKLIDKKIFVATYWPNVKEWVEEDCFETYLQDNLIAIPIDQRYGSSEMELIVRTVQKNISN